MRQIVLKTVCNFAILVARHMSAWYVYDIEEASLVNLSKIRIYNSIYPTYRAAHFASEGMLAAAPFDGRTHQLYTTERPSRQ